MSITLPAGRVTFINPQGHILGFYRDVNGRDHGFLIRR
jgi:hypothetical protein